MTRPRKHAHTRTQRPRARAAARPGANSARRGPLVGEDDHDALVEGEVAPAPPLEQLPLLQQPPFLARRDRVLCVHLTERERERERERGRRRGSVSVSVSVSCENRRFA
eukprot:2547856-Rhodomonas_salina.1